MFADEYIESLKKRFSNIKWRLRSPKWKTKDGRLIKLCDMDDGHLVNVKRLLRRRLDMWNYENAIFYDVDTDFFPLMFEMPISAERKMYAAVCREFKHRGLDKPDELTTMCLGL